MFVGLENPRTLLVYTGIIVISIVVAIVVRYRLRP